MHVLTGQIGSINGVNPPGMETFAYSASKAALHQYVPPLSPLPINLTVTVAYTADSLGTSLLTSDQTSPSTPSLSARSEAR